MDFSDKQLGWIETGTALGTGVLAFEQASTIKFRAWWGSSYGLLDKRRFKDAIGALVGKDVLMKIFPDYVGPITQVEWAPNIFGAINKTSLSGAAILIADAIAKNLIPQYRKMDGLPSVVHGAGVGITIGGAIGGIFDPNPSGYTALGQKETGGVATGNVPFAQAGQGYQLSVLQ
jgi:hypothetical protein